MELGAIVSANSQQLKEIQRLLVELYGLPPRVIDVKFADLPAERRIAKARSRQSAIRSDPVGEKVCANCGSRKGLQRHHLIPTRFGGRNVRENLMWLCRTCHKKVHEQ